MRRMHFRFQRILELKERVEEARKASLGQSVAVLEHEREQLSGMRQLKTEQGAASDQRTGMPDAPVDASLLQLAFAFRQRLEGEIVEQRQRIDEAEVVVDERRQELIESTKERRVFEVLKDRVATEYRREQRRQERILLDEAGKQIHLRKIDQPMEERRS